MPPQYALLSEQPLDETYPQRLVALVADLESRPPAASDLLCEFGVTHIYLGQRRGLVGAGVRQLYDDQSLAASPEFRLVYEADRVRVYAISPELCSGRTS